MKHKTLFFLLFISSVVSAQMATIKGEIKNSLKENLEGVAITCQNYGTSSDRNGQYELSVPANSEITIIFSHLGYKTLHKITRIPEGKVLRYSPVLEAQVEQITEVIIENNTKNAQGTISLNPSKINNIPGANQGVENLLMTLPGVNNSNELSTQYNVRGGNFDENLVYVNGIEVYRPFLVRAGQQEGLSFVNGNMVQNIKFSAGGFQAKYGDKLASVLDITYRTPTEFSAAVNASFLGGSVTFEDVYLNNKLTALVGLRYRNTNLFINSTDTETNAKPNFTDVQTFLKYSFSPKFSIDFLGNYALNNYHFKPISRRTKFGSISNPLELIVFYNGKEEDTFETLFGAISANYAVSDNLNVHLISSNYHTKEKEFYDILANYNIGEVNNDFSSDNFGEVAFSEKIGSQLNHARNILDALINSIELKANHKKGSNQFDFGLKFQKEDIRDQIKEYEIIDSLGFSVRPPHHFTNNQPYEPFTGEIVPYQSISAKHSVKINRFQYFAQFSKNTLWNNHKVWYNLGVRGHHWTVKSEEFNTTTKNTFSVRSQFAIKPDWEKDMLFRIALGMYNQPPFYKEFRDESGVLNPLVNEQKSIHLVLGNEYSFKLWNRPFKLISEVYFKNLTQVNTYTVDNVKIRYKANNNAEAYATGIDLRLNGEFVPGTDSWVSIGFLKTKENYNQLGYISRPTDQFFKFGMLFQDYVPNIPNIKMYLNMVFNSGVPGGSPAYANPYDYQNKLNAYKRADIGVSYIFKDKNTSNNASWLKSVNEFSVGIELFNMFDVQNSITNTWVRDVYSKQFYGIPNYMTPRVLNMKLDVKF